MTVQSATLAEYLAFEQKSVDRHEFHDGEILAMSGGTYGHSLIAANIVGELRERLRGKPCRALDANMRVATKENQRYVYPDVSVVCGKPVLDPADPNQTTIINPQLVVEVLSDSTEAYDRGDKFNHYRRIESLREYILVAQDRPLVESFVRQNDDTWSLAAWEGLEAIPKVRSLQIELPLAEVYAGVEFNEVHGS